MQDMPCRVKLPPGAEASWGDTSGIVGPDESGPPVGPGIQGAFYGVALYLTLQWLDAGLWVGWCGTPYATQTSFCYLFALVAGLAAAWACFSRRDGDAVLRFTFSGAIPVLFPWIIVWLCSLFHLQMKV